MKYLPNAKTSSGFCDVYGNSLFLAILRQLLVLILDKSCFLNSKCNTAQKALLKKN